MNFFCGLDFLENVVSGAGVLLRLLLFFLLICRKNSVHFLLCI
ncbi:unnamed protein product [Enterobius vermicularis]|uniref:Uncharacterized protein n=1 Tax=Enterobius vermicularis TaxID=51028 RepID=A0A0N4UUG9_ENTVE|nr:unnamed protein product [Enterobius vermicularis]